MNNTNILQAEVGWIRLNSSRVTNFSLDDAISTSKLSLGEPKSAHSECCSLSFDVLHIDQRWSMNSQRYTA